MCAARARGVLQDALQDVIFRRDYPQQSRSDAAAVAAAKAAAKRAVTAAIAAGGASEQLEGEGSSATAGLLDCVLGPVQLKKLLLPLLRLRQACCHPQVCFCVLVCITGLCGYV